MGFNSWQDFHNFEKDVKFNSRFVHSQDVEEFLYNIKRTLPARERSLALGTVLFRGQVGYEEYESEGLPVISGFPAKRMKPIPNTGKEGRANPKGISYLYLANDENTALAELRPHLGQYISSAQFQVQKNLRLIDCYSVPEHYSHIQCIFKPPQSQEEITNAIWSMINEAFTKPVTNEDERSDYVPTQILAEHFKSEGFDGVCFKSSMGTGHNFILFNLDDAELINCTVMEAKSINYEFKECANRYYVQKEHNK
ncbi:MAG: RES family NAD+ phosphorylase [Cellvibrionaceae bacterium]|nr:RES family NAD+ phosphorylase [Cellvibrionaceae bacterium]